MQIYMKLSEKKTFDTKLKYEKLVVNYRFR